MSGVVDGKNKLSAFSLPNNANTWNALQTFGLNISINGVTLTSTPAQLNTAETFTALQKFTNADFALLGSSTGYTLLESGLGSSANNTLTLPTTTTDTLAGIGTAQTWAALQKFTNGDLALLGSSTGYTLLESGLSSSSNNTLTLPVTASDTLAAIGTAQAWSALQTFGNNISIGGKQFSISGLSSGQVISYNGTNWVNATASGGG